MYKIAVIGDRESVLGFKSLGLSVFACPIEDAAKTLHRLAEENYGVIYITEHYASKIGEDIARYHDRVTPAVILIPSKQGTLGLGLRNVKTSIERAVGADIFDR